VRADGRDSPVVIHSGEASLLLFDGTAETDLISVRPSDSESPDSMGEAFMYLTEGPGNIEN
jgi:hypothetical protein